MSHRYNILLFDGFSNHCLANMVEPLRAANSLSQQTLYVWRFCSLDGKPVQSSSGLVVTPHGALHDHSGDVLAVMPSYGYLSLDTRATTRALLGAARAHPQVAGLDTGSWLLARAGLLDDHRATIHWDELSRFEEAFPAVDVVQERFVIDGNRLTCSGAMAAFDLASALIRRDHGPLLSMEVAHLLMSRNAVDPYALPLKSEDTLVNRALAVMQGNVETPLTITDVARKIGCSQKKIEMRVQAELRTTPQALYRRLRLTMARKLAEETEQSIAEIASRCGYENASAMTRAFKAEFGRTPTAFRNGAPN
ncbi:Carnitine catabolism transcriptional activator [Ruegeria denitrificans]|uniref:Carnitine catabolism transcriptional activator n=1 Tax=Ruegeria denitrificans TaxID=1715692 RepID=A0A0P1IIL0_9RHOB|nr:GlxA family transcriptional regulator [Ruegeria denitrificans]CUJ99019.1 Carnitine catabolism transcriptional activator [Ruegeria denitrificans]